MIDYTNILIHLLTGGAKTLPDKVKLAVIKILATLLICISTFSFSAEREAYMVKNNSVTTEATVTKISVLANLTFL